MPEKREIVEQTAQDFEKLPNDMKMYVLGYMARCMEERGTREKARLTGGQKGAVMSTTLNARRVYEALAKILAKKENAVITVTVKKKEEPAA